MNILKEAAKKEAQTDLEILMTKFPEWEGEIRRIHFLWGEDERKYRINFHFRNRANTISRSYFVKIYDGKINAIKGNDTEYTLITEPVKEK